MKPSEITQLLRDHWGDEYKDDVYAILGSVTGTLTVALWQLKNADEQAYNRYAKMLLQLYGPQPATT